MPLQGEYAPGAYDWSREQADSYAAGDQNAFFDANGRPVVLMTSVGAKSGKLRRTPLMRVEHDGEYAAVASIGGAPENPAWYFNLKANPHVELQDGSVVKDYLAREVEGEERQLWWDRAVAALPVYEEFQEKTSRLFAVFVLTELPG